MVAPGACSRSGPLQCQSGSLRGGKKTGRQGVCIISLPDSQSMPPRRNRTLVCVCPPTPGVNWSKANYLHAV